MRCQRRIPFFLKNDDADNLAQMEIDSRGRESWQVHYAPDGRLASLSTGEGHQVVLAYCRTEQEQLICASLPFQQPGTASPSDSRIVRVCPGETVLTKDSRPAARRLAAVFSLVRDLERAHRDVDLTFCKGRLTTRPPEITSMGANVSSIGEE